MPHTQRVTLTLPADVVAEARAASQGNLSGFVASTLRLHLDRLRRRQLRRALVAGYIAEAELDLQLCEEFLHVDREAAELSEAEDRLD